jgi:hypothetical protein
LSIYIKRALRCVVPGRLVAFSPVAMEQIDTGVARTAFGEHIVQGERRSRIDATLTQNGSVVDDGQAISRMQKRIF